MNTTNPGHRDRDFFIGSCNMKVGLYVDVANIAMNGGFRMRYDVLRDFACRGGAEAVRLNAYVSYDPARAESDPDYKAGQFRFHSALRDIGYKVIQKETKWYTDETGAKFGKANVDLDLAVDALLQSSTLDRVVLVTGDGDFVQVIKALQNKGCRVEVVAFDNVSADLRREADLYHLRLPDPRTLADHPQRRTPEMGRDQRLRPGGILLPRQRQGVRIFTLSEEGRLPALAHRHPGRGLAVRHGLLP